MQRRWEYSEDPPVAHALLNSTRYAWLWLLLRLWLGYQWLEAASHKLGNPDWVHTGAAVRAFWERAVLIPPPPARPPVAFDWYRGFLLWLLSIGAEGFLAGTASTNPMMFLVSLLLVLAWKAAGYYGLDRWLLPALGTPWRPGRVFRTAEQPSAT